MRLLPNYWKVSGLIKASFIYLFSDFFNKLVPFLLLPILTRYLSPAEYGLIAIVQVLMSLFLSSFGNLHSNIARTYFRMGRIRFSSYMTAVFIVLLSFFLFSSCLAIIYYFSGFPLFGLDSTWYLAMPVIACMNMANLLNLTLLRTQEKPCQYAAWELSHTLTNLGLSLVLVIGFHLGWEGRAIGIVVPMCLYGCFGIWALARQGMIPTHFRWSDVRETFAVSIPLVAHVLASVANTAIDRLFIDELLGTDAVGIYTVGYQFGMVILIFSDAFLKAWQPWFYKSLAGDKYENKVTVVKYSWYFIVLLSIGALIYSAIAQWILPYVVDKRYYEASSVILPVAISYIAFGAYQIIFPYLVMVGKTKVLAIITPTAAVVNIGLNLIWIPQYGILGAAYATIAAYVTSFILVLFFVNKYYPMPWLLGTKKKLDPRSN